MAKIKTHIQNYTANTSLHGLQYIGESGRPLCERLWWIIIIVLSMFLCGSLIRDAWIKWQNSPVIVSLDENLTPVWNVPFPAITICSENKIKQTVFNFTHIFQKFKDGNSNISNEEQKQFGDAFLTCDKQLYQEMNTPNFTDSVENDTIEFIQKIGPQLDDMFLVCKYWLALEDANIDCDKIFHPVITEDGFCFTFNGLNSKEFYTDTVSDYILSMPGPGDSDGWDLNHGYPTDAPLYAYPFRPIAAGANAALTVLLKANPLDFDYICKGPISGFEVILHHPADIAPVSQQNIRIALNQDIALAVKPEMLTTSKTLRGYSPKTRKCFFSDERKLKFYRNYTQQNCELECMANFTIALANCAPFYMPHDNSTPICGSGKADDLAAIEGFYFKRNLFKDILEDEGDLLDEDDAAIINTECNCLPGCFELQYSAEVSQVDFHWKKLLNARKENLTDFDGVELSRLTIYMKQPQFITSRRSELYGRMDFLANCGGLLGLFMGFSFLSLIELFYFFTVRLFCNNLKTNKKSSTNL